VRAQLGPESIIAPDRFAGIQEPRASKPEEAGTGHRLAVRAADRVAADRRRAKPMRPALFSAFADETSALCYLEALLWPDGPVCPRCGVAGRVGKLDGTSTRLGAHKCYACRKIFSITQGTLFEGSHVPLHKWLQAIYLTDAGSKPLRPYHLAKVANISGKTARSMLQKLKKAAQAVAAEEKRDAADIPRTVMGGRE